MTQKWLSRLLLGVLVLGSWLPAGCEQEKEQSRKLTVIVTGSLKGNLLPYKRDYAQKRTRRMGGFAYLVGRYRELEKAAREQASAVLLLDLGSHLSGSVESYVTRGQMVIDMMNHLPFAASLVSNLEFSYGLDVLRARLAQAKFPYISTNVDFHDASLNAKVAREVLRDCNGVKVAILGCTPPNLSVTVAPDKLGKVTAAADIAPILKRASELKQAGTAIVILLTKVTADNPPPGFREAIAASDVDLVLGTDYEQEGGNLTRWGKTMVSGVPGDSRGSRMRVVELALDQDGHVVDGAAAMEVVSSESNPDPEILRSLEKLEKGMLAAFSEKIGSTTKGLPRGKKGESPLADVIVDAMRTVTHADVAVLNSGAIQDDLSPGDVCLKDLFRAIPFDNNVVAVKVKGAQLQKALETSMGRDQLLQVSGMSCKITANAEGELHLVELKIAGKPVDPAADYRVACTDFVLARVDSLNVSQPEVFGPVRDLLAAELKQHSPLDRSPDGRLTVEQK